MNVFAARSVTSVSPSGYWQNLSGTRAASGNLRLRGKIVELATKLTQQDDSIMQTYQLGIADGFGKEPPVHYSSCGCGDVMAA